jgi:signal transduction histidine kinase/DNA-binding response OmpR family regulator
VVGWLFSRLRRIDGEKNDLLVRLQLAQQALDQTPLDLLWTDPGLKVIQTNQSALQSAEAQPLIGSDLLALHPDLINHPYVTALQSGSQEALSIASSSACLSNAPWSLVAANSQKFAIWCRMPENSDLPSEKRGELKTAERDEPAQAVESASRMKSEFIANINHEIRTPMNAIIGYAEMLINADLGKREKRFVNIIHKSSLTLVSIFNDIMELSKIDSGRMQIMCSSIRLQSIINEVEELFREQAQERNLRFRCRIAPHLPKIIILDGVRLKQVLQNLVSNAIKFTANGYVELTVDGNPSQENSGYVDLRFKVEDSGIGIPVGDQEKIFELFQQREDTISKQYGGVGLGLTLCSRLVAMMKGRIELFSHEGEGARFTVFLDALKVAEQAAVDLLPEVTPAMNEREQKLLIVDDVDLIKDVFIDFFQNSSFTVLTANTGEEALTLAVKEKPGIIFMDLNLIGMDGRTVTERLRNQSETAMIPVVVMTGDILDEADYKPLFDDFLQKPFRLEELKEIVARYIQFGQNDTSQSLFADSIVNKEQITVDGIVEIWTEELEQLRSQAVRSGSLADAVSLGAAMLKAGETTSQSRLSELGGELVQYAAEPNILGVDRLLAKLTSIANRK